MPEDIFDPEALERAKAAASQEPVVTLTIIFEPRTGDVRLQCSVDNRMLAYGLLGMAQEIVIKQGMQPERLVQPVRFGS